MKRRSSVLVFASGVMVLALAGNSALADEDKKFADRDLFVKTVMAEPVKFAAKQAAKNAAKNAAKQAAIKATKNAARQA